MLGSPLFRKKVGEIERLLERLAAKVPPAGNASSAQLVRREADITQPLPAPENTWRLPTAFKWANDSGEMRYSDKFHEALAKFTPAEQRRIARQLRTLAEHGPEYPSLKTKKPEHAGKVPYTPYPCFVSRAARYIRFSWTKPAEVVVHFVFDRNNRDIPYNASEA